MDRPSCLLELAQALAAERPKFFDIKGPSVGDRDTAEFMRELRNRAREQFGHDFAEKKICGEYNLCVDFYFPEEATIVEVALGLRNPTSEFERDILKAIMAQESGQHVEKLLFVSKPGALKRCAQPGARAITSWAKRAHRIAVEVREIQSEAFNH